MLCLLAGFDVHVQISNLDVIQQRVPASAIHSCRRRVSERFASYVALPGCVQMTGSQSTEAKVTYLYSLKVSTIVRFLYNLVSIILSDDELLYFVTQKLSFTFKNRIILVRP